MGIYEEISSNKRKSFFLVSFFIVIIVLLGYVFGLIFFDPLLGLFFAFVLSMAMTLISIFSGDKILLKMLKAQEARRPEHAKVINIIEGLSIAAGIPKPKIYLIDDTAINAFATGYKPEKAAVTFTTGALQRLNKEELEGVAAHEISHIKNYDIRLMLLVATLVGISVLISDMILRSLLWGGGRRDKNKGQIYI